MKIRTGQWANPLAVHERIRIVRTAMHDPALFSVSLGKIQFFPENYGQLVISADKTQEDVAYTYATKAIEDYDEVYDNDTSDNVLDGANTAVICNDGALTHTDEQYWIDFGNSLSISAPLRGGTVTVQPCVYWTPPPRPAQTFVQAAKLPMLLLQSQYDGATPLAGAQRTASTLTNSRMVVENGTYNHDMFSTGNPCIYSYIADYFLTGEQPPINATCEGKTLAPPPPGATTANTTTSQFRILANNGSQSMFSNPELAEEALLAINDSSR